MTPMRHAGLAVVLSILSASCARAQTLTVIAKTSGSVTIGAFKHGVLYGTVTSGGGGGAGLLFSLTVDGTATPLHSFVADVDGSSPNARLGIAADDTLVGTAQGGGIYGEGTLWQFAGGQFTVLHAFGATGDGAVPLQGPTLNGGTVLGATSMGAISTNGAIFRLQPNGKYKNLHEFVSGSDGHCPFSGVAHGNGLIYGTTVGRGFGGDPNGSIFSLTSSGVLTTLYLFTNGKDGEWPDQAPVLDSAGNLYGTTHVLKGKNFAGAVWKYSTTGNFSVLHALVSGTDGYAPNSPLVLNTDGNLYGSTYSGGVHGYGTIFRITLAGGFTVMHSFTNGTDGGTPSGNLVHDGKGTIYGGMASGQVFSLVP